MVGEDHQRLQAVAHGIAPRHQRRARRRADRHAVERLEPHAVLGKLVDIRRLDVAFAIAEIGIAEIIGQNHDEIDRGRPIGEGMLRRQTACEIVLSRGWLRHTPTSFQCAVLDRCRLEQFDPGAPIYSIGDESGGMFGIVCLGISVAPQELGSYTAHFALPGSWFGQASAFARQPRRVGLTATRDTELLHLPL